MTKSQAPPIEEKVEEITDLLVKIEKARSEAERVSLKAAVTNKLKSGTISYEEVVGWVYLLEMHKRRLVKRVWWLEFDKNVLALVLVLVIVVALVPAISQMSYRGMMYQVMSLFTGADGTSVRDEYGNPTTQAAWAYVQTRAGNHKAPPEYIISVCWYESGGKHFGPKGLVQGVNKDVNGVVTSTDWGLCQVSDKWHPDQMSRAKSADWRENLEVGWELLDDCWSREDNDNDRVWCYNGKGKNPVYPGRVMANYRTQFWLNVDTPYVDKQVLVRPNKDARISGLRFSDAHPGVDYGIDGNPFPVVAVCTGKIVAVIPSGLTLQCTANISLQWRYYHLSETGKAENGAFVIAGQEIAIADGSIRSGGESSGPHLHLEAYVDGKLVDPEKLLASAGKEIVPAADVEAALKAADEFARQFGEWVWDQP